MMKIRVRVIVGVMIFFGYFMIYVTRYNLSVHIVDMVARPWEITRERKTANLISSKKMDETIPQPRTGNIIDLMYWSDSKISLILAAYHIGFVICFPIIHNFGDRYGPKWVVGVSGFLSGLLGCLTPASAYYSYWLMFFIRVLIGFCAGAMQPSMVQVLRHWMPPTERPYFMWAYCGATLGTCCTFLICAVVQYYASWSIGFHIYGAFQITWAIVWLLVVTDSPQKHSFISEEELTYLSTTICNIFAIKLSNSQAPWRLILKSVAFWMLCILNFGYSWIIISVCLHGPMYYSKILHYSIYEASALTALPFLLRLILGTATIHVYYWYKNNTRIKKNKNIRKYFIFVSHVIPGGLLSLAWCLSINPGPYLLTIALAFTAAGMDLTLDICYELSPNYLNSVCTVIKIISNIPGIIVPLCVGEVVLLYKDEMRAWKGIWGFDGTFLLISGLIFLVWGRIELQPWNDIRLRRPQRKLVPTIRPSTMSNITEGEEEDTSVQSSIQGRSQLPQLFRSLRLSN